MTIRLEDNFAYDNKVMNQGRILGQNAKSGTKEANPAVTITQEPEGFQLWYDRRVEPVVLESWQSDFRPTGLAIDIGTTTMVISLVSLQTGVVLASASSLPPQVAHGHDVLTRINYAKTPETLDEMGSLVQDKLNDMVKDACSQAGLNPREIVDVAIGANTTMLQLAAKMDSTAIGRTPFSFDLQGGTAYSADKWGLEVNKATRAYLPPIMHAFVGTEITAGLLRCQQVHFVSGYGHQRRALPEREGETVYHLYRCRPGLRGHGAFHGHAGHGRSHGKGELSGRMVQISYHRRRPCQRHLRKRHYRFSGRTSGIRPPGSKRQTAENKPR